MAYVQLDKIFLGRTPVAQRKYSSAVFRHLVSTHPKLVVPASGAATLVGDALEAGYKKENIETSDISLFTSLLGYLFSGKPISEIKFQVADEYRADYEKITDDIGRVAYLMWLMKMAQLSKIHYRRMLYEDLLANREKHIALLAEQIKKMRDYFFGINYEIKDLRDEFVERDSNTLLVINPPVFKNCYEKKMFNFQGFIEYESGIKEFDFKKEYHTLYEKSKELSYPCIWYRYRGVNGFNPSEVIYAREYQVGKTDFFLCTKPSVIEDRALRSYMMRIATKRLRPYCSPTFGEKDGIDENSTVRFVSVPEEVGLYYRDLFAHRLGTTGAEHYYLMLIDGKVFSTCGFTTSKLFRLKSEYVFENFGFSVSLKKYPQSNRLLMMMLTSKEFGEVIRNTTSNKNRIYNLIGMKTTCISKYRSIKTHQGILERISRETLPNGLYKIQAQTKWHDRDFKETLRIWLEEQKLGHKVLTNQNEPRES